MSLDTIVNHPLFIRLILFFNWLYWGMKVFIADGAFGGDLDLAFSLSEEVHQRRRGPVHLMSLDTIVNHTNLFSFAS